MTMYVLRSVTYCLAAMGWYGGESFDREKDLLALATRPVAPPVAKDWNEIVLQAQEANPDRVADRFPAEGPTSAAKRRLFESVQVSDDGGAREAVESVKLLSRLRIFSFDFDAVPSSDEGRAIEACRNLTRSGTLEEGQKLWDRCEALAKQGRSHIFFMDARHRSLYEKPFVIELFISHLVQSGREGHNVLTIPL